MDHNATTPALAGVVEAMRPYFTEEYGNPSSSHAYGRRAASAVEEARAHVAALIGAGPDEILFTAGATESDNLALRGAAPAAARRLGMATGAGHIITCAIEHEAVLETCEAMREEGWEISVLPVDGDGLVEPGDVARAMTDWTVMVSLMMANNEIGTVEPLEEVGRICRRRGVLLHSDAVQGAGRVPLDVETLGVDLMSLTAHKMYGPKGIGALYVRRGVPVSPMMRGGGQEGRVRSGTLNVPGIVGFGKAAQIAMSDMAVESARESSLRDLLWRRIRARIEDVRLNGHPSHRLPNNLNVAFDGVESEALLTSLRDVVALSSGSACASGSGKGSYVIRALRGGDAGAARSSIRFGLGRCTVEDDIDLVMEHLERAVSRLRAMAPKAAGAAERS
jgi:cysteine desulfurase